MLKGRFSELSNFNQVLLSLCLVVVSAFTLLILASFFCLLFFDINIITDISALNINASSPNITAIKAYQAIYSIGMFIIPPFLIAYFLSHNVKSYLQINRSAKRSNYILTFFLILTSIPLINTMGELNSQIHFPDALKNIENWMRSMEEHAALTTYKFLEMSNWSDFLINLILIAIIPALGEELLFRGVLQKQLSKWTGNVHWGIFISAMVFSALHMQFFGFFPRLFLGMLFGYLLIWTGSLWVPIFAHFVNNATAVTFYYFTNKELLPENIDQIDSSKITWWISLALFSILIFQLFYTRKRQFES